MPDLERHLAVERLELMASGDPKWDLSPNDRAAIHYAVQRIAELRFDELREANVARCEEVFHPLSSWSPTDWSNAMAGEAGEACNITKKHKRGDGGPGWREALAAELADVVIYADLVAARCGSKRKSTI